MPASMRGGWIAIGLLAITGCGAKPAKGVLTFIAVGQGSCAVFQEGGYTMLIDAGPKNERFDAGEKLVLPELRRLGVKDIDLLVLSHPDSDHIGGLAAISRKHDIKSLVVADHFRGHPELEKNLREARLRMDRVAYVRNPSEVKMGRFTVRIDRPHWSKSGADNDGSLFVWLGSGSSSAVFTGDAGMDAERMMAARWKWKAQIAHLGHHGSYTATSHEWLKHVDPRLAVISCGRANAYGHPHQEVLDRLDKVGIEELRTDRDGTIQFRATAEGFVRLR